MPPVGVILQGIMYEAGGEGHLCHSARSFIQVLSKVFFVHFLGLHFNHSTTHSSIPTKREIRMALDHNVDRATWPFLKFDRAI